MVHSMAVKRMEPHFYAAAPDDSTTSTTLLIGLVV
jgi:hypothetical protein